MKPLLEAVSLSKSYGRLRAVDGVSLTLARGETLGLVGESGSGKSTLAKMLLGLVRPDTGRVAIHASVGAVFQEPYASLDPRWTVRRCLSEPFAVHRRPVETARLEALLAAVELPASFLGRRPHELSGGECQRVSIARALALEPELLLCDEAVSALDAYVRAQILNLLLRLQTERGLALFFISHDLRVIRHLSDRIAVMKDGRLVETSDRETLFSSPQNAYTRSLLASAGFPV